MKYRNCPKKDGCGDYSVNNCDGCVLGEKFAMLERKIKNLKTELVAMRLVATSLANELNMTDKEFAEEVKKSKKKQKER